MEDLFYPLLAIGFICIFVGTNIYIGYVSSEKLGLLIDGYFEEKKIDSISKLTISEKLIYGIPINLYFLLLSKSNTIFLSFNGNYFRRLEFKEKAKFVYVQIVVRQKKIVELKEFPR